MASMLRHASITEQRADKDCLLSVRKMVIRTRTSLGVIPVHVVTVATTCDRTFADIAGLFISVTAEED